MHKLHNNTSRYYS